MDNINNEISEKHKEEGALSKQVTSCDKVIGITRQTEISFPPSCTLEALQ